MGLSCQTCLVHALIPTASACLGGHQAIDMAEGTYLKDFNQCPRNPGTWSCVSVEQLEAAASLPRRRVLYSFP